MNADPSYPGDAPGDTDATAGSATEATPCLQIQMDLSAMLDGELEAASVRRVLVHSDVCPACRSFLDGIRGQMRAHRELVEFEAHSLEADPQAAPHEAVRRQLLENRAQLARILYQLGRSHVLLSTSPSFSREVAAEPVPIPDVLQRCRAVLAEVSGLAHDDGAAWVPAQELFEGDALLAAGDALQKGMRLFREALALQPDLHEARIYLGHAHHMCEQHDAARAEFRRVLAATRDPITRAFALVNLGNVYLEQGDPRASIPYFEELVASGVVAREPRFFTSYFNLALAYGLELEFEACRGWLRRLWDEFPHKRGLVGVELAQRPRLVAVMREHAGVAARLAEEFDQWFPLMAEVH